jgi:hypothetical protein
MAKETKDQREIDREAELARQKEVTDALAANEAEQLKVAQDALKEQQRYETTGIRTVEGKP